MFLCFALVKSKSRSSMTHILAVNLCSSTYATISFTRSSDGVPGWIRSGVLPTIKSLQSGGQPASMSFVCKNCRWGLLLLHVLEMHIWQFVRFTIERSRRINLGWSWKVEFIVIIVVLRTPSTSRKSRGWLIYMSYGANVGCCGDMMVCGSNLEAGFYT